MAKIKIIWTGGSHTIRTIDAYEWSETNSYTCAVDEQTAANLLTYPHAGQWKAAPDQTYTNATIKKLAGHLGIDQADTRELLER